MTTTTTSTETTIVVPSHRAPRLQTYKRTPGYSPRIKNENYRTLHWTEGIICPPPIVSRREDISQQDRAIQNIHGANDKARWDVSQNLQENIKAPKAWDNHSPSNMDYQAIHTQRPAYQQDRIAVARQNLRPLAQVARVGKHQRRDNAQPGLLIRLPLGQSAMAATNNHLRITPYNGFAISTLRSNPFIQAAFVHAYLPPNSKTAHWNSRRLRVPGTNPAHLTIDYASPTILPQPLMLHVHMQKMQPPFARNK
jgi:hypothetical protein